MTHSQYCEVKKYIKELLKDSPLKDHVYLVGGCVRDALLGQEISDIDLFVNVPRGAIRLTSWLKQQDRIFPDYCYFRRYMTTKFRFKDYPDMEFDVSCPHHNPAFMRGHKFSKQQAQESLLDDCLMRDLTVNSLFLDIMTGKVLDLSGKGLPDMEHHIIRTTSTPEVIYADNPACMIRTVRFSVKYGWEMAPETRQGLFQQANLLLNCRPSRIHKEYSKVLASPQAEAMQQILQEMGVLDHVATVYQQIENIEIQREERERQKRLNREEQNRLMEIKAERKRQNREKDLRMKEAARERRRIMQGADPKHLTPEQKAILKEKRRKQALKRKRYRANRAARAAALATSGPQES